MGKRYWYTKSSRGDKIAWLLNHQKLWKGWVEAPFVDERKRDIVEKMRKDGLISETTYWKDVNVTGLIHEARKLRRTTDDHIRSQKHMRSRR